MQVPLQSNVADVAVFCLSLMGTDTVKFLLEARRVLRPKVIRTSLSLSTRSHTCLPWSHPVDFASCGEWIVWQACLSMAQGSVGQRRPPHKHAGSSSHRCVRLVPPQGTLLVAEVRSR